MTDNKRKIGIVDDHAMLRKGIASLINLFPNDKVILEAGNGKEFIECMKKNDFPDIVLMDINMPEMDGFATTEWLSLNYPDIKVIALSTMNAETSIIRMIKSGAKGYILKDAEPSELRYAFDEVMRHGYFYNELVTRKVMNSLKGIVDPGSKIANFMALSPREIEFLKYACSELTYKQIADKMFLSPRTIDGYRELLCEKLGLKTRVGLVLYSIKNNIVQI